MLHAACLLIAARGSGRMRESSSNGLRSQTWSLSYTALSTGGNISRRHKPQIFDIPSTTMYPRRNIFIAHNTPSVQTRRNLFTAHNTPSAQTRRNLSIAHNIPSMQLVCTSNVASTHRRCISQFYIEASTCGVGPWPAMCPPHAFHPSMRMCAHIHAFVHAGLTRMQTCAHVCSLGHGDEK